MTVRWLIPGQSLLINHQVFPLTACHLVLERKPPQEMPAADQVPTVELWFDTPIDGSVAYAVTIAATGVVQLQRLSETSSPASNCKWLVCVDGEDAVMLRQLIQLYAEQTTQPCLGLNDVPTSAVSTIADTDRRVSTHAIRQPLNHWLEECPNYWDYIDVDHPSYH